MSSYGLYKCIPGNFRLTANITLIEIANICSDSCSHCNWRYMKVHVYTIMLNAHADSVVNIAVQYSNKPF